MPNASGSVTTTHSASRQSKSASSAHTMTVEAHPAMSCGSVLESMLSRPVTSPMMLSATSETPRRLKKLMGSLRRWSARSRRTRSDCV